MTILTSIAMMLIAVYGTLPHNVCIVLYVFSGVSLALELIVSVLKGIFK